MKKMIDLEVCTNCLFSLANGPETDEDLEAVKGMLENWPGYDLFPGDLEDPHFSPWDCEGCGNTLGGDRHQAWALKLEEI